MRTKQQGSITLFLALILTLVFSLFFSLLEAARVQGLDRIAERSILLELESALGEYQPQLWKNYRLLFLDAGNDKGELDFAFLEGHWMEEARLQQKGAGFYQIALQSLEITSHSLATDVHGAAFEQQACKAIKEQLAAGAANALKQKLQEGEKVAEESLEMEQQWESAKDAMTKAESIKQDAEETDSKQQTQEVQSQPQKREPAHKKELPENPVESVDLLKKSAILTFVVENPAELSVKTINISDTLRHRKISPGNLKIPQNGISDKIWFLQYLNHYFSCKTEAGNAKLTDHALDYELEYCIAGKASDQENLQKTVKRLLLIRQAGNFTTIMQDGKKQALAMEIAAAAVGFTGVPPLIQAVQIGILLAWSYIESILDVRCLLAGGSVPLVKQITDWKSDVALGEEILKEKKEQTKSQKEGLDYREYLQILLLLVKEKTLVQRAMDVVEQNIRKIEPAFRMNHQIHGMQLEGLYSARPLFLGFVTGVKRKAGDYHFRESHLDFYLK
ncbi:hypothetical protein D3Z36_04515 [Lachnospiraceae bacterium]|nr:hypothetical protein [Lachnospiraceae bacterium]